MQVEKNAMQLGHANNELQDTLKTVRKEKEELQVSVGSLEDKLHKMETDRESMRVKAKQQLQKIDESNH